MRKVLFLAGMIIATPVTVNAHSWYPSDCCSGQDCAPVTHVLRVEGGVWLTTLHGTAFAPHNFAWRPSQDAQMHACMRPLAEGNGKMELLCAFRSPGT